MQRSLRGSRLRRKGIREDINPLESVVNITDAMLVFACGLLLAVIMNWNVDIGFQSKPVDMSVGKDVTGQISKEQGDKKDANQLDPSYKKMGTLYEDPTTGKMYMITEE